jgi:hypothetical protein
MAASDSRVFTPRYEGRTPHLVALFVAVGAFFLTAAIVYDSRTSPSGDEPHYLVISETLLRYHSFEVAKTYHHRDYLGFYSGTLDLSHTVTNYRGVPMPVHGVGGPILWLPLFAAAGRLGATLFVAVVSLLVIVDIFMFLDERGIRRRTALLVAGLFAAATPFFAFAHVVFIDVIGALAVIHIFRKVLKDGELRRSELLSCSMLLGILPWVHVKFIAIEGLLLVFLLAKVIADNRPMPATALKTAIRGRWMETCFAVVPAVGLGLGFEAFNLAMWGSVNPGLVYGQIDRAIPFTASPLRGLIGTFLDQEYGVFISAPLLMLAIPGFVLALRDRVGALNLYFPILTVCYVALFVARYDWQGGWTPPGRFILVLLPVWAYYIGYLLDQAERLLAWPAFGLLAVAGIVYNLASLQSAHHGFSTGIGQNQTIARIQQVLLHRSLTEYMPSTVKTIDYGIVVMWVLILCVVCWLMLLRFSTPVVRGRHTLQSG